MKTFGPYSPIKKAGNLSFISGQIGLDPESGIMSEAFSEQALQALQNLNNILRSAGLDLISVVKTTIYLVNITDYQELNKVYNDFFGDNKPARSTVAVAALPNIKEGIKTLIEIEAVAIND